MQPHSPLSPEASRPLIHIACFAFNSSHKLYHFNKYNAGHSENCLILNVVFDADNAPVNSVDLFKYIFWVNILERKGLCCNQLKI